MRDVKFIDMFNHRHGFCGIALIMDKKTYAFINCNISYKRQYPLGYTCILVRFPLLLLQAPVHVVSIQTPVHVCSCQVVSVQAPKDPED